MEAQYSSSPRASPEVCPQTCLPVPDSIERVLPPHEARASPVRRAPFDGQSQIRSKKSKSCFQKRLEWYNAAVRTQGLRGGRTT